MAHSIPVQRHMIEAATEMLSFAPLMVICRGLSKYPNTVWFNLKKNLNIWTCENRLRTKGRNSELNTRAEELKDMQV